MKKIIPLMLCILLFAGCAQVYDGPTESKQVLTEYRVTHDPWGNGDSYIEVSTYDYDIYGRRVRHRDYGQDGELEYVRYVRYSEDGREIRETDWDYTGWIPFVEDRSVGTYDEQGRKLSAVYYDCWGRETGRSTYTYDDEANTMRWEGDEGYWNLYYLDEEGREIRTVSHDGYETVNEYDEQGNMIGWVCTVNGKFHSRYEAKFDDQGRCVWQAHYDETDTMTHETEFVYDDERNTRTIQKTDGGIRVECYLDDGRMYWIEDYDAEGNRTMLQQYFYTEIRVPAEEG